MKKNITVSVIMLTYNHERFIEEAIKGVLLQITDFNIELLIYDDNSYDSTKKIVKKYKKNYPNLIKTKLRKKNIGMMKNFYDALSNSNGKYIAICEGDDFWIDQGKLKKQVDFLNKNNNFSITSSNCLVKDENSGVEMEWPGATFKENLDIRDLLKNGSAGATCSLVFRKNEKVVNNFLKLSKKVNGGDWLIQILCTEFGSMKYFSAPMSVYRRHSGGATFVKSKTDEIKIFDDGGVKTCEILSDYFNNIFDKEINYNLANYFYLNLFKIYKKYNDELGTKFYIKKILAKFKYLNKDTFKYITYFFIKLYLIDIYYFLKNHLKEINNIDIDFLKKNDERKDYERLKNLAKDKKIKKIHLGSGPRVLKKWINLDIRYENYQKYLKYYTNKFYPAQIRGDRKDFYLFDVTKYKIPFLDNSVEIVFHEDFIEHLNQKEQILLLAEIYRVLKPGAVHRISTPSLFPALKNRLTKFKDGYDGIGIGIWNDYLHKNILTPKYLKEVALKVGYKKVIFSNRDKSLAKGLPLEYRPDPKDSRDEDHIFCDLIK